MENQEAVKKLPQLAGLRGRQFEAQTAGPIILGQRADDLFCAGSQPGFFRVRLQAEFVQQLEFKGQDQLRRGGMPAKNRA